MGCIGNCAINENNHMCCLKCPDYVKEENQMKYSEKLKPCQFYGAKGYIISREYPITLGGGTGYLVICSRCGGRAGDADTKAGAVRMWNWRTDDGKTD